MSEFNEELTATIVRRRRSTTGWLTEQEFWAAVSTSTPDTPPRNHDQGGAPDMNCSHPADGQTRYANYRFCRYCGMALGPWETERERGLYGKYRVARLNDPDDKHKACRYFVLDPQHDPLAVVALRAYAEAALAEGYEVLAAELSEWADHPLDGGP